MKKPLYYIFNRILPLSVAVVFLTAALNGCKNDLEEVARLSVADTLPSMYSLNVTIAESESGRIKYLLTAPELQRYEDKSGAVIKFPKGFKVEFFDSLNPEIVRTQITADYGINNETLKTMEAHTNVVIHNFVKDETLNTEQLIWNQHAKKVYSNNLVTITTPGKILYGEGMESDENFFNWTIKKPRGEMYINEDQ